MITCYKCGKINKKIRGYTTTVKIYKSVSAFSSHEEKIIHHPPTKEQAYDAGWDKDEVLGDVYTCPDCLGVKNNRIGFLSKVERNTI
jgi:hypothetical protein